MAKCVTKDSPGSTTASTNSSALRLRTGTCPPELTAPLTGRVEFANAVQADNAGKTPGARRVDGRAVEISAADMPALYAAFRTLASLGRG